MSNFIPNSYQTPNIYSDKIFHLLSEAELRCVIYMCRRTYGFGHWDGEARISLSQLVSGTVIEGRQVDHGTGLSRSAVVAALKRLQDAGLIEKIDNGDKANAIAALWRLEADPVSVDMVKLEGRREARKQRNAGKADHLRPSSSDEPRPSSSDEPRPSSSDEPRPSSSDEPRPSSSDEPRPSSSDEPPIYRNTEEETQLENQLENQSILEQSSSSSLLSDQGPQKSTADDDDDDDFILLEKLVSLEFSIPRTETLKSNIQEWLGSHPASHVEAAIRRAAAYSPKSPIPYISEILFEQSSLRGDMLDSENTIHYTNCPIDEYWPESEVIAHNESHAHASAPAEPSVSSIVFDPSCESIWDSVLLELQESMPPATFDTWLKGSRALGMDGVSFVIGVENSYSADWLRQRLGRKISRCLNKHFEEKVTASFSTAIQNPHHA